MISKFKFYFILFYVLLIHCKSLAAEDFSFESKSIEIINSSNKIISKDGVIIKSSDGLKILADESIYLKNDNILIIKGNVSLTDTVKNIILKSDNVRYDKKNEIIATTGNTKIIFENKYTLISKDISFHRNNSTIQSNSKTNLKDNYENNLNLYGFNFNINSKQLTTVKMELLDKNKNLYKTNNTIIDLTNNRIAAKDIELIIRSSQDVSTGRLKGSSMISENNISKIQNGIFTSCKERDDCPPWSIEAAEISHNKEKKIINYKNSLLRLYDVPVFYFPKFFHPDPTVNRQSGFLMPSLLNSTKNGSSIRIPYYKVLAENKDITFTPQIFMNKDILIQNEYRQVEENINHISDVSLKKFEKSSKSHFFSNTKFNLNNEFDYSELSLNIEKTSNDTYLKSEKIKSNTRNSNDTSLLTSYIKFDASSTDTKIFAEAKVYEDLTQKKNSDKYQYIFPNFKISKILNPSFNSEGILEYNLLGSSIKKETNVNETRLINDFNYTSKSLISKIGTISNYKLLFKNTTKKGQNSKKYRDDTQSENYGGLIFDTSLPLGRKNSNYIRNLTPKISFRYSPHGSENNFNSERNLSTTNLFSKNRLNLEDSIEGGKSITLGANYSLISKKEPNFLNFSVGQIFRDKEDKNLPKKTTMQNKQSDLVGSVDFGLNEFLAFEYKFSADNNLDTMNLNQIETELTVNNFVTSFEFLEENNDIGTKSFFESDIKYSFNSMNSLAYNTRRNRKTNLTEFYNLIYEYKNDCLVAAIEYNKDYYQDRDLKPNEEILFSITITPFTSVKTPNLKQ